jgi:hypothetical protein
MGARAGWVAPPRGQGSQQRRLIQREGRARPRPQTSPLAWQERTPGQTPPASPAASGAPPASAASSRVRCGPSRGSRPARTPGYRPGPVGVPGSRCSPSRRAVLGPHPSSASPTRASGPAAARTAAPDPCARGTSNAAVGAHGAALGLVSGAPSQRSACQARYRCGDPQPPQSRTRRPARPSPRPALARPPPGRARATAAPAAPPPRASRRAGGAAAAPPPRRAATRGPCRARGGLVVDAGEGGCESVHTRRKMRTQKSVGTGVPPMNFRAAAQNAGTCLCLVACAPPSLEPKPQRARAPLPRTTSPPAARAQSGGPPAGLRIGP